MDLSFQKAFDFLLVVKVRGISQKNLLAYTQSIVRTILQILIGHYLKKM